MYPSRTAAPFIVKCFGDFRYAAHVATTVTDKKDVSKTMSRHAARRVFQDFYKMLIGKTDGSRETHMTGRRIDVPFRHMGHDRGHESLAQFSRYKVSCVFYDVTVLA